MPAIADLVSTTDRQALAQLANPPDMRHLARIAAATAGESSATGRTAWLCTAVALGTSGTIAEAREALKAVLGPGSLLTVALACLAAVASDNTSTETT